MLFNLVHNRFPALGENLREMKQDIYHALKMYPIYGVIRAVNNKFPLRNCRALEAFAYTGSWQARAYRQYPAYLEAWEINPQCKPLLEKNLPGATVRITDSIVEIGNCTQEFGFINIDNHQGLFGKYCEHFEFFPLIFPCLEDRAVVMLNTIPAVSAKWKKQYPDIFTGEHLRRRKAFYHCDDPANVSQQEMIRTYTGIAGNNGYRIDWHFFRRRSLTYYLALGMSKIK